MKYCPEHNKFTAGNSSTCCLPKSYGQRHEPTYNWRNHPFRRTAFAEGLAAKLTAVFLPNDEAVHRFYGSFTANIRNNNTRRVYYKAACRFWQRCQSKGLLDIADVKPIHVAVYIEMLAQEKSKVQGLSKPTIQQHLAALRTLFDWLLVDHVIDTNSARAVHAPKYSQNNGETSVVVRDEVRALLAAIDPGSLPHLRDRALFSVMIFTFARVGVIPQMNVCDYYSQGRRAWVRLQEKGGKEQEPPCILKLEAYLNEYIAAAGIGDEKDGPRFRTAGRSTGTPHRLTHQEANRLVQRHTQRAEIETNIGNQSMCATGITDYLRNGGSLSEGRQMANHADTCTTQLYDQRAAAASLEEYGRVGI